jgi:hypothetical protein
MIHGSNNSAVGIDSVIAYESKYSIFIEHNPEKTLLLKHGD